MSLRPSMRSSGLVSGNVVKGGMLERSGALVGGADSGEGEGGGSVWDEEGLRSGVEELEDMAEWVGGRTRFERRAWKKAAQFVSVCL
jgi:hypothetical protein